MQQLQRNYKNKENPEKYFGLRIYHFFRCAHFEPIPAFRDGRDVAYLSHFSIFFVQKKKKSRNRFFEALPGVVRYPEWAQKMRNQKRDTQKWGQNIFADFTF